jgi:hypothetical protein
MWKWSTWLVTFRKLDRLALQRLCDHACDSLLMDLAERNERAQSRVIGWIKTHPRQVDIAFYMPARTAAA